MTPLTPDEYCIQIRRFGCAHIEEHAGRVDDHRVDVDAVRTWLDLTLATLCPGDSADIRISRGRDVAGRSLYAEGHSPMMSAPSGPPPAAIPGVGNVARPQWRRPPLPGDDHPDYL